MSVVAIIQARMGSTRLPPMLALLIERIQYAHRLDHIVVATTNNPPDDVIEELTRHMGVGCFRGSEQDVESSLPEKYWTPRLTVDTDEDFELISRIFEELYPKNPAFSLRDVLDLLDRKPELMEITRNMRPKAIRR